MNQRARGDSIKQMDLPNKNDDFMGFYDDFMGFQWLPSGYD
jgi:hypothetical protein